jgi:hypothetical protein
MATYVLKLPTVILVVSFMPRLLLPVEGLINRGKLDEHLSNSTGHTHFSEVCGLSFGRKFPFIP